MRKNLESISGVARAACAVVGAIGLAAATASAQPHTVHLVAAPVTKAVTLPNGTILSVPMWGFGLDANANGVLDEAETVTVPGPRITVPPGVTALEVHLANALPVAVSLVIPGQAFDATPVRNADGRIISMTAEAPPGGSHIYTFSNLRPGTYLYQSGTHQAVQVQMGLYGAMSADAVAGEAYPGVPYAHDLLVLYSEIDIALHEAVNNGTYGQPALGGPTSTVKYKPTLFLVNGESYANELSATLAAGTAGQRTLLRLLNAGLRSHVPVLDNGSLAVVAEDGNPSPFARDRGALLLAAGKTHDAIWSPSAEGTYALYDRALSLSAEGQGDGGMLVKLKVDAVPPDPNAPPQTLSATDDSYAVAEDGALVEAAASGVLSNDSGALSAQLVAAPRSGTLTLNPDGGFSYQPAPNFFGVDAFSYQATDGTTVSRVALVSITVAPVPDAPVANAQSFGVPARGTAPIRLTAADPDSEALTYYVTALPLSGTLRIVDANSIEQILTDADLRTGPGTGTPIPSGHLTYVPDPGDDSLSLPPFSGTDGFAFLAADASSDSGAADVSATVHALDFGEMPFGDPLALTVVGSDGAAINEYWWTLEVDRLYQVVPGVRDPDTLSVSFHASYMPVTQTGDQNTQPLLDGVSKYFVSVLPKSGPYSNSGAAIAPGRTSATITVNTMPLPTARIRVRVFEDNSALNGQRDTVEVGLAGFEVGLDDAGGRYGMSGGQQLMDAFGNQIGTVYAECSTGPGTCTSHEVVRFGSGFVLTDAEGYALISNLPPGKFAVKVRPPSGTTWVQTSTIEGTLAVDAWVKPNEPQYFTEFGPPGPHVEIGFTRATTDGLSQGDGPFTAISGRVTNMHMSRPPDPRLYSGAPFDFTRPWVALNTGAIGGTLLYTQPVEEDGSFRIEGVPSGTYQLVVFDSALDIIIGNRVLNVAAPAELALGDVPVFQWFARLYNYVFDDANENGIRDAGEAGIPEQAINIRWRDGSMYQSSATDGTGFVPFEEVFPFFSWLVAEVDYTRFKATGVSVVVDNGGDTAIDAAWPGLVGAELDPLVLAPQPQSENGGLPFRTETGPVLLQAFQAFLGQSNVLLWGKTAYAPPGSIASDVNVAPFDDFPGDGDTDSNGNGRFDADLFHGGISGIVHYSTTRAENDPRWGTGEPWEPGIPGVRVQLWDAARTTLLNEVTTDSWDASKPSGCQGDVFTFLGRLTDCYDGLRNFNQVRPGVFDGGFAFYTLREPFVDEFGVPLPIDFRTTETPLSPGRYVVKVIPPEGYKIVKEEDKNVDFGEEYIPQDFMLTGYPLGDAGPADAPPPVTVEEYPLAAPFCVGTAREVPPELALFPSVPVTYAGQRRPLCDTKLVTLRPGSNTGVNFFLFTSAPVAGHIMGFVLDDTTNEFDPNAPTFGEKYAPPFMPVAIRDWTGREITRTYTDQYGSYNVLVPSTYTANAPIPSGMAPNMLTACINSPTMPGLGGTIVPDPHFYKEYSHFCYTFQYMPGTTTYLDTPVIPTGAFTGTGSFPVDAELPSRTPVIASVRGPAPVSGPYIVDQGPLNTGARTIVIRSAGPVQVPNPAYDGVDGTQPKVITRDFGFGNASPGGFVKLGGVNISVLSWTNLQITAVVPTGLRTGQLTVERCLTPKTGTPPNQTCADGRESVLGVTLTVATPVMHAQRPPLVVSPGQKIQAAIDAAIPGDLIVVRPGTYEEMVVMTKPVRLQGSGALSTALHVVASPAENLQAWRDYVGTLLSANPAYLLAGQSEIIGPFPYPEGALAAGIGGEGAGVFVFGKDENTNQGDCLGSAANPVNQAYCLQNEALGGGPPVRRPNARIDGFTIAGASQSAAIMVNAHARYLEISNNKIVNNYGVYAGGIQIGQPGSPLPLSDQDANNGNISIHNNAIAQNAGLVAGGGGGVVIGTGATGYQLKNNFIAANFTGGQGAGISHIGLSAGGSIDRNTIVFNESFNQGLGVAGAGIFIGGRPATIAGMTPGSGSVSVTNNLIHGNQAASGDGGGVALSGVNGTDIAEFGGEASSFRHRVELFNNVIANNVAGLAGGGIAMQDAAYVSIVHNTIVHNDSLATAGAAFTGPNESAPQPAGIVSRGHTPQLASALGAGEPAFSNPFLSNSIVWQNRSFYFGQVAGGIVVPGGSPVQFGVIANPAGPYWDLGVLGASAGTQLSPTYSVLTSPAGYDPSNTNTAPTFVASYLNGSRRQTFVMNEITTGIQAPAAFDEGGNFIRPQFGPLSLEASNGQFLSNHHVASGVVGTGLNSLFGVQVPAALLFDFDSQPRPVLVTGDGTTLAGPHRGADQRLAPAPRVSPIPR